MCSAALEAFGDARTLSDPIQHAKSEEVGCGPSEPLDSLIGDVLANQCGSFGNACFCLKLLSFALFECKESCVHKPLVQGL